MVTVAPSLGPRMRSPCLVPAPPQQTFHPPTDRKRGLGAAGCVCITRVGDLVGGQLASLCVCARVHQGACTGVRYSMGRFVHVERAMLCVHARALGARLWVLVELGGMHVGTCGGPEW